METKCPRSSTARAFNDTTPALMKDDNPKDILYLEFMLRVMAIYVNGEHITSQGDFNDALAWKHSYYIPGLSGIATNLVVIPASSVGVHKARSKQSNLTLKDPYRSLKSWYLESSVPSIDPCMSRRLRATLWHHTEGQGSANERVRTLYVIVNIKGFNIEIRGHLH